MQPTFDFDKFPLLQSERLDLVAYDLKYANDIFTSVAVTNQERLG